ncbi:hypothetical protein GSI_12212 [Ganoderma sinense ZZ0214-1]|uniref:Transporter n=1 Tax=Ganoderma sinense ZZ0214-1 TaxID=1077348 RepID=A0A2G8RY85_9APHY|nr:hypothetical protein GSI_12212 [Ganoderma sinense ZZ0214-1]
MYFVPLACLNMLHIILTVFSMKVFQGSESYRDVLNFIDPYVSPLQPHRGRGMSVPMSYILRFFKISSLLVCSFLLALHEANQQLTDGSFDSESTRLTLLYFADPSTLPPFVAPLGGLVNSTSELEVERSLDAAGNGSTDGGTRSD